jgi:beta-lactamase class D
MKHKQKIITFLIFFSLIFSNLFAQKEKIAQPKPKRDLKELKVIFDKHGMKGSFLICNQVKNDYLVYNEKRAKTGYLPASTFKIPNSIIGLETGVINSETVFKWDSTERSMEAWERDLSLKEAFQVSCVPCYQEVARKIGIEKMRTYLDKFKYGKMKLDEKTLDNFWLEGESKITSYEQIEFLKKLYEDQFNLKHSTKAIILGIMQQDVTKNYKLYGKTGWSIRNGNNYGWFVGFLETPGNVYFFAVNLEPKNQKNINDFAKSRKQIAVECLQKMGLMK